MVVSSYPGKLFVAYHGPSHRASGIHRCKIYVCACHTLNVPCVSKHVRTKHRMWYVCLCMCVPNIERVMHVCVGVPTAGGVYRRRTTRSNTPSGSRPQVSGSRRRNMNALRPPRHHRASAACAARRSRRRSRGATLGSRNATTRAT